MSLPRCRGPARAAAPLAAAPLAALWLGLGCLAGFACAAPPREPPAPNLELAPAARELDYLERALRALHPDPFGRCGEARFRAERAAAVLREGDPDGWHLTLRRLVALVGDAHTRVEGLGPFERSVAPILLQSFADGWWILAAFAGHDDLVGTRVLGIEGRSMPEVLDALRPYVSFENEASLAEAAPNFLRRPAFLHAIGLTAQPDALRLLVRSWDGFEREVEIQAATGEQTYLTRRIRPVESDPWLERNPKRNYWHAWPVEGALYVRHRRCAPDAEQTPEAFADAVAAALAQRPRVAIVDLRGNGGGNSQVLAPVIDLFTSGGPGADVPLYALTDAGTFSSALLNAWQLRKRAGALLAGEPSAQRPNAFGELRSVTLPVSGARISCSTKSFRLVPGDPEVLAVDVSIPRTGEDWFRGRDPLLAHVLEQAAAPAAAAP